MTRKAVYAGSFDPPTNGHMFMIREGARLFDELVVAVGVNPDKRSTFSVEERVDLLRQITAPFDNVTVESFASRYLVRYAAESGAGYILRGLRNETDFQFENMMRQVNTDLEPDVSSVFLITPRRLAETSSSFVKGLVGPQGWRQVVNDFVPEPVYAALLEKFGDEEEA
ncbi:MAG: pantetheine-phosphate adenylyltransferase [Planctomycetota bacterium]